MKMIVYNNQCPLWEAYLAAFIVPRPGEWGFNTTILCLPGDAVQCDVYSYVTTLCIRPPASFVCRRGLLWMLHVSV